MISVLVMILWLTISHGFMAMGVMVFPNSRFDYEVVRYGAGYPNSGYEVEN